MADGHSGSILAADFGNVTTRAILIDMVDGVYRMVARGETRTTAGFPVGDVMVGLKRAAEQITSVTGRKLAEGEKIITPEQADRSGVDHFVATASIGRSLRTVLVGLVPDVSLASGLRATAGTYIQIVESLSLDDERNEEEQLNALLTSRSDLVFITGGTEDGAREPVLQLARVVRLALTLLHGGHKPVILFAGNSALDGEIRALFSGLTTVLIAPNIRPTLEDEELEAAQLQLALAFDEQQTRQGSSFEHLGEISELGVLPTAQSYNLVVEYLGQTVKGNILAVDLGSAVSTLSASVDGKVTTAIRTDIGLGHSAGSLLNIVGEKAIERWLPFATTANQIEHYTLNKMLRPGTIPETLKGLYLEHALLRAGIEAQLAASRPIWTEKIVTDVGDMPPFSMIIGAGAGLTRTGHPGFGALLLLDSLEPTGVTSLYADPYGLIAALGALAHVNPEAVVQVLDSNALEHLGTSFSLSGQPGSGKTAMKVKITLEDGQVIQQEVPGGHLWVYPLGLGKKAKVEVRASARGTAIAGKSRVRMQVESGVAGLIFDARGRPLPLAETVRGRAAQMPAWISEATGDALIPIPDDWLVEASEDRVTDSLPVEESPTRGRKGLRTVGQPKRGGVFGRRGRGKSEPAADDGMPEPDFEPDAPPEPVHRTELDELRGG